MVAPIRPDDTCFGQASMSPEAALAALRATFGEPDSRMREREPRWHVTGPFGGAWLDLRNREGVPILMVHSERGCTSEICDVMFLELRSPDDVALIARKLGVYRRTAGGFRHGAPAPAPRRP